MNCNDILELIRAGYTKEEINAMTESTETEKQTESNKTEQKQEETAEQKNEEAETNEGTVNKELFEAINSLKETVRAMQANNAKKVSAKTEKELTSESAIKSFFEDIPKN